MVNQKHKIQFICEYKVNQTANKFLLSYVDLNQGTVYITIDPPSPLPPPPISSSVNSQYKCSPHCVETRHSKYYK